MTVQGTRKSGVSGLFHTRDDLATMVTLSYGVVFKIGGQEPVLVICSVLALSTVFGMRKSVSQTTASLLSSS